VKIVFVSAGSYAIPAINFFAGQNIIQAVASIGTVNKNTLPVQHLAGHLNLPFKRFLKTELLTGFKSWLTGLQPDVVLVFGCAYKIPEELFAVSKLGFYNVHFSLLPAYRGRNPLFWQIKNGETMGGITVHKMAGEFDAGPILTQKELPIYPGENHGLFSARLSMESIPVISMAIEKLRHGAPLDEQNENAVSYAPEPSVNDLRINWETQSAKEIENLVNAANPDYGGAITLLRGQPFRILEVAPAEINNPSIIATGTIVHADLNYGVFVACKDLQFLRINVIQSAGGILSGFKLAGIGVAQGERFESPPDLSNMSIKI
jgi:methionyl-tRNA formyltransferase